MFAGAATELSRRSCEIPWRGKVGCRCSQLRQRSPVTVEQIVIAAVGVGRPQGRIHSSIEIKVTRRSFRYLYLDVMG